MSEEDTEVSDDGPVTRGLLVFFVIAIFVGVGIFALQYWPKPAPRLCATPQAQCGDNSSGAAQ
jgi:hypothetical protein